MSLWASLYEAGKIDIKKFLNLFLILALCLVRIIFLFKKRFQKMENPEFIVWNFLHLLEISSWAPHQKDRNPLLKLLLPE